MSDQDILTGMQLSKHFPPKGVGERAWITLTERAAHGKSHRARWRALGEPSRAVDGVDVNIRPGEILGLVGESGSGKTTLARVLACLSPPTEGRVRFEGELVSALSPADMRARRSRLRMMFQSPAASLNPYLTVRHALYEAIGRQLQLPASERETRARDLLAMAQLDAAALDRYPSELSGGQQRRVGIARALVGNPSLVIADEPVAALDASIQAQIVRLIQKLNQENHISFLVISHNLAIVRYLATRMLVMFQGRVVEEGDATTLANAALHPYTVELMRAANYNLPAAGVPPEAFRVVPAHQVGCAYQHRCALYPTLGTRIQELCRHTRPALTAVVTARDGCQNVSCHAVSERAG
ncbi:ABC transporter ATP-binding protein [Candidatus Poribacteria bacterium]|nr:ABC transporter ATP-binding protein [Candidatus Poribacteria bacterium]